MAKHAADVWAAPTLPSEALVSYQTARRISAEYAIEDHPHLLDGKASKLFQAFRQEVKALDPCVSEQFLKLYVAYKADTNFADVIPQAKALLISVNIDPHELTDPRQMGVDVTGIGRWGNGNTEVRLTTSEDVPYVIGLVRQALDRQLSMEEVD